MNKHNSIYSDFIKYVSANILGMIGLSCYILADTFFVARGTGSVGLAALNLAIPVYSFISGLGMMAGMGGATRYAILRGEGKDTRKIPVFSQAVFYALILSFVFLLAGIFLSNTLANLLGASGTLREMTNTYLKVVMVFAPMFMMNNVVICFVRNDGNPKLAMAAMVTGSLSNILMDYLFIFPLNMGIFGAALATGISPIISLSILSLHFAKKRSGFTLLPLGTSGKLTGKSVTSISSLGASAFITEVSSGIVMIVFNTMILKLNGSTGVAAYGIIANIALVVISIFNGISQGVQPIISTSYGTGSRKNIKTAFLLALVTAAVFSALIYVVSFFYAEPAALLFNKDNDPELTQIAVSGIRLYFTAFLFVGVNIITATYLNSIDRPGKALIISSLRGFLLIIPMAFLLSALWGLNGVWITLTATEAIVTVVSLCLCIPTFLRRAQ